MDNQTKITNTIAIFGMGIGTSLIALEKLLQEVKDAGGNYRADDAERLLGTLLEHAPVVLADLRSARGSALEESFYAPIAALNSLMPFVGGTLNPQDEQDATDFDRALNIREPELLHIQGHVGNAVPLSDERLDNLLGVHKVELDLSRREVRRTDFAPILNALLSTEFDVNFKRLNVIVDVSGSNADSKTRGVYWDTLKSILPGLVDTTFNFIFTDTGGMTHVHNAVLSDTFEQFNKLGGGGTQIQPAIDYVTQHLNQYPTLILTDDAYEYVDVSQLAASPVILSMENEPHIRFGFATHFYI